MNKYSTIQAISDNLRMRNHDVQRMIEVLIDVWSEELASGGRIEIENFLILEVKTIKRQGANLGQLTNQGQPVHIPTTRRELKVRASKEFRMRLRKT